ncbi:unnamed protein product [Bursaphelenchus okinawaensis]|uniref:BHLH domain-containing protein n=1 Tax=Bursaphelenchus okinawaensis TaxID=465554 RepID=A0A811KDP2_9BILA|nr:unnamed protein product [Bursaphelenchus okinawaensis]CAG9101185.1 unnamed protein product [Bursaphelenchus okinawaensis]
MTNFDENTEGGSTTPAMGFAPQLQSRILGEQRLMAEASSSNNNIQQQQHTNPSSRAANNSRDRKYGHRTVASENGTLFSEDGTLCNENGALCRENGTSYQNSTEISNLENGTNGTLCSNLNYDNNWSVPDVGKGYAASNEAKFQLPVGTKSDYQLVQHSNHQFIPNQAGQLSTSRLSADSTLTATQIDRSSQLLADQSSQDDHDDNNSLVGSASPKSSSRSSSRTSPALTQHRVQFDPKTPQDVEDRKLRRQIANCNERRRMQSINAGFQSLRQFLPQKGGDKMSKAAILQQTADLILSLKAEKEQLSAQIQSGLGGMGQNVSHGQNLAGSLAKSQNLGQNLAQNGNLAGNLSPNANLPQPQSQLVQQNQLAQQNQLNPPSDPSISNRTTPKKRRMEEKEAAEDVTVYLKTIDDLKQALNREQQLRILYEKELLESRRVANPLALDPNLLNIGDLLRKNEALQSPRQHEQLNILTPNKELGSPSNLAGDLSPLMNARKAVLNSALLQRQGLQGLQNTAEVSTSLQHSLTNNLLSSQQSLLNPAFLNANLINTQSDIRSMNLSLAFTNPQQRVVTTTVQTAANNSVQASLLAENRNLNALLEAIRQIEGANLNSQIPVQQRLAPSNGFNVPANVPSSQNGNTDLLVR